MNFSAQEVNGDGGTAKLPPMLSQYLEYKRLHPDALIFFQVGDFYEVFFEDAVTVAGSLNLTLTSRDKSSPTPIPMCGVPVAVVDGYLERLVDLGFSVAVVSQAEPATPGRGMVRRELERIVTPGIRLFGKSESASSDFIAALYFENEQEVALAYTDVPSGVVLVREGLSRAEGQREIIRLAPAELVVPQVLAGKKQDLRQGWLRSLQVALPSLIIKFRPDNYLSLSAATARVFTEIDGYATLDLVAKKSVRVLVSFIDEITCQKQLPIKKVRTVSDDQTVLLDANSRKHLELVSNAKDGSSKGTLLDFLDCTRTQGGRKLLRQWLLNPLTSIEEIHDRQDAIEVLLEHSQERKGLLEQFSLNNDLERIAARIELLAVLPRELAVLRDVLESLPRLKDHLGRILTGKDARTNCLQLLHASLERPQELFELLSNCLAEDPPFQLSEGGVIKAGFSTELDHLRAIRKDGKRWITELELREKAATGINSLKIRYNGVLGYYIEVTKANLDKVPAHYVGRQSTVGAERFFTDQLKLHEKELLGAEQKQFELEKDLYQQLKAQIIQYSQAVRVIAAALSQLDLFLALASGAEREQLVRPVVDQSFDIEISQGRHPILAKLLQGRYVPNDLEMTAETGRCLIVTGPNMGGKSTYLRQAALIVIMAQIGSFVPVRQARIGVVDRIFTRLGASDDLSEGESTFMVEMREAAAILANASKRSLLLIDEIGRGTATTDGLAIAQAILEWIVVRIKARTLFATHFRELTQLEEDYQEVLNLSVGSVEQEQQVVFTHQICRGSARKSYGVEVAKLAGLPPLVLQRAASLMAELDHHGSAKALENSNQLSMFESLPKAKPRAENPFGSAAPMPDDYPKLQKIREDLVKLEINDISPVQALNFLAELQNSARKG